MRSCAPPTAHAQLYVGLVIVGCLVFIGALALLLELLERNQDAREKSTLRPALPL